MSYLHYYKTADAAVVVALASHFAEYNALRDAQNRFARRFGAIAMHSAMDQRFLGVYFKKPPKAPALWSRPTRHGMQVPRRKGGGEEGDKLRELWDKHLPTSSMATNVFLDTLNLPQFCPGRSLGYALKGKTAYIAISTPLTDRRLVEIVASEYMKATKEKTK